MGQNAYYWTKNITRTSAMADKTRGSTCLQSNKSTLRMCWMSITCWLLTYLLTYLLT